jgi:hypothetical protein
MDHNNKSQKSTIQQARPNSQNCYRSSSAMARVAVMGDGWNEDVMTKNSNKYE